MTSNFWNKGTFAPNYLSEFLFSQCREGLKAKNLYITKFESILRKEKKNSIKSSIYWYLNNNVKGGSFTFSRNGKTSWVCKCMNKLAKTISKANTNAKTSICWKKITINITFQPTVIDLLPRQKQWHIWRTIRHLVEPTIVTNSILHKKASKSDIKLLLFP